LITLWLLVVEVVVVDTPVVAVLVVSVPAQVCP